MLKSYQMFIFSMCMLSSHNLTPLATIDTTLPNDKNGACVAQQYNSWGSIHAPVTIIQSDAIADLSKMFNPKKISNVFQSHRLKILVGTTLASYVWILYQIRFTCLLIKQHNAWCNWKSIVPITHLQLATREDLFEQLKIDISKKYTQHHCHATTCELKTLFVQEIHNELNLLDTYLKWQSFTETIYCSRFFKFPFDAAIIEEKKARLYFLLEILATQQAARL